MVQVEQCCSQITAVKYSSPLLKDRAKKKKQSRRITLCFFSFGMLPSGVATANHLPPSNPVLCIFFSHNNFMSFTTSRNLLFALLLSLLPANSNLCILLLMFSLPLLCTCPSNLTLALTPEHPTCGASFLVQSVLVSFEMKHKHFIFSYLPPVSTSVPPASLNIKDHTELPFNVCFTTTLHLASALIQVFKPSLTHFAPCKLVEAWLCHTGLYA